MRFTKLKKARLERGLLQIELASVARIARCRLSEIENGHLQPTSDERRRLAAALGMSVGALQNAASQKTTRGTDTARADGGRGADATRDDASSSRTAQRGQVPRQPHVQVS